MNSFVKIYLPNEVMNYIVKRVVCKTVWQEKTNSLFLEIESTDDLDHIEEDALQNQFPKILLTLEDFPIKQNSVQELFGEEISIPKSYGEITNEDGDTEEVLYTNLSIDDFDYETIYNTLTFYKSENGKPMLKWVGKCNDFANDTEDYVKFELNIPIEVSA